MSCFVPQVPCEHGFPTIQISPDRKPSKVLCERTCLILEKTPTASSRLSTASQTLHVEPRPKVAIEPARPTCLKLSCPAGLCTRGEYGNLLLLGSLVSYLSHSRVKSPDSICAAGTRPQQQVTKLETWLTVELGLSGFPMDHQGILCNPLY
jgi:hypothetical protein